MTRSLSMDDLALLLRDKASATATAVKEKKWEDAARFAQEASSAASRLLTRARLLVELRERGDLD